MVFLDSKNSTTKDKLWNLATEWDILTEGYVGIHITGSERAKTLYRKDSTALASNILNVLHRPHDDSGPMEGIIYKDELLSCTKLKFITSVVKKIQRMKINLDIAIIASSKDSEAMLNDAILNCDNLHFTTMSKFYSPEHPCLFGLLIRFRSDEKKPNFRLRVDNILVYDGCLMTGNKTWADKFSGVYFSKPKIASIVCLRTPDIYVSKYKHDHPDCLRNLDVPIKNLLPKEAALFRQHSYPRMNLCNRELFNEIIADKLTNWMKLKNGAAYNPHHVEYESMVDENDQDVNNAADKTVSSHPITERLVKRRRSNLKTGTILKTKRPKPEPELKDSHCADTKEGKNKETPSSVDKNGKINSTETVKSINGRTQNQTSVIPPADTTTGSKLRSKTDVPGSLNTRTIHISSSPSPSPPPSSSSSKNEDIQQVKKDIPAAVTIITPHETPENSPKSLYATIIEAGEALDKARSDLLLAIYGN